MLHRIIPKPLMESPRKWIPIFFVLGGLVSSCVTVPSTPGTGTDGSLQTPPGDAFTPSPQGLAITPTQSSENDALEMFSSDRLSLCFSYPKGYTQLPYNDAVEIVAPENPDSDTRGLFWLEISDSYNRTAEEIADQDMSYTPGLRVDRWSVTLGGQQALVLDGMPGQDLVRRVYIVHHQTLYVLVFSPTHSKNAAASGQMEALYAAIIHSWAWSPCSSGQ